PGVSILVAESNLPDIALIRSSLSDSVDITFSIDTAVSGSDTLEKASDKAFDLVLMNESLPGMTGLQMLKEITERKLGTPVIMIVADGRENYGAKAMDKGAYDYLTKEEVKTNALERAIKRAISRKKLEHNIKESVEKLQKLAIRDGLTQLYNHQHFAEVLKNEFKKAQRHMQPLSCIMMDLDYFKSVNDNFGHQFGDYVLSKAAGIITMLVRDTDCVARYGGEEFAILLSNTQLNGAHILAERIRSAFANNVFRKGNIAEVVTVSMGVSSLSDENVNDEQVLLANADEALYRAKRKGRNTVCTSEESSEDDTVSLKEDTKKIKSFFRKFQNINENMKESCIASAQTILQEIESGWNYINEHSVRVSGYAEMLSKELRLSREEIDIVKRAALLHDVGMIGIDSDILKKKGKLTDEEYDIMKKHSNIGVKLIEKTRLFEKELPVILCHHERFDGTGYPQKLRGLNIPYGARILAIAEAYDTMLSNTVYTKARSPKKAAAELKQCAGTQFDPHIVDVFIQMVAKNA
nr:diguanylate cyclase [Candidatus Brocadiales bacterium]